MRDDALVIRAQQGDAEAFEELVRSFTRMVFAVSYDILQDANASQDAVQETFLKAWLKLPGFRREARFSTWLYAIARNTALDMLRKRKARARVSLEEVPEPSGPPDHRKELLEMAMGTLSERERACLRLRFQAGMTGAEIGQLLGLSEANVRVISFRARKKLREALRGREDELFRS